jgi:hypothetical protein
MKKFYFPFLLAGVIAACSCNSNGSQGSEQRPATDSTAENRSVTTTTEATTPVVRDNETQATLELCSCVNSFLADMSPQVREILVRAGKSNTPVQTLATELQQVKGAAEQERLFRELEKFENDTQLQRCSEGVKVKYNLDENDTAARAKVLRAAEEARECEVVYALMKIGLEQEKSVGDGRRRR